VANPKTATAPAVEPVTPDEAKKQARIPHTADDTYVASLIVAAREAVENFLNRRLITATLDYFLDHFPGEPEIELPGGRLQSITSLKYTDSDGDETTVAASLYFAVTAAEPGALRLAYGESWPSATLRPAEAVVVRYVAGYGLTAATVPADIRHAILLWIANYYNDHGDEDKFTAGGPPTDMPIASKRLLWPHRIETRF
jgi:uncharacterized phiE125 gp8 family phage protein